MATKQGLKTAELYRPTTLETRSLKSSCHRALLALKALRDPSLPLPASGDTVCPLTRGCVCLVSACVFTWPSPSVPDLTAFLLYGHLSLDLGPTQITQMLLSQDPSPNDICKDLFQISPIHRFWISDTDISLWGWGATIHLR